MLFATSASTAQGTDLRSSASDMPDLIRGTDRAELPGRRAGARPASEVDQLSAQRSPGDLRVMQLTRQANALTVEAGTAEVRGPVVVVELDDAKTLPTSLPEGVGADDIVVHQQDVQAVVNALWPGGAEAMMLMDQRVISTSAVRCVGNTLILQGRVYSPPYRITAIGDPTAMRAALDVRPPDRHLPPVRGRLGLGYEVRTRPEHTCPPTTARWILAVRDGRSGEPPGALGRPGGPR